MKRILCLIVLSTLVGSSAPLLAGSPVDISIGANVWYSWWNPPWEKGRKRSVSYLPMGATDRIPFTLPFTINNFTFKRELQYLGGPALSIRFLKRWSISSVFAMGRYIAVSMGPFYNETSAVYSSAGGFFYYGDSKYRKDILKYDSDSTINCSINKYFKIFIGFKYQGYTYTETAYYLVVSSNGGGLQTKGKAEYINYGPGVGIGLTIPLGKSFYLLFNLSGSYLFGSATYNLEKMYLLTPDLDIVGQYDPETFSAWCGNISLSFGYYIAAARITLALGGRYQVLYFKHKMKTRSFLDLYGEYDHFYGITMSVLYSFRIGGKGK